MLVGWETKLFICGRTSTTILSIYGVSNNDYKFIYKIELIYWF